MRRQGFGIKSGLQKWAVGILKKNFPPGMLYNAPRKAMPTAEWIGLPGNDQIANVYKIRDAEFRQENPPRIFNHIVSNRFKKYFKREIPPAFVLEMRDGFVFGASSNFVISPDGILLSDLSREFGSYGGKRMVDSSILTKQLWVPKASRIKKRVAIITTCGYDNFHHWNYDCLPRIFLLRESSLIESIDYFVIAHTDLPFQRESLRLLGIPESKIINPAKGKAFSLKASILIVPSLPENLGTISPWVVSFLDKLYNPEHHVSRQFPRVYLSRKNASTRKIVNNKEFTEMLKLRGFVEVFPEEHSVMKMATIIAGSKYIISIHGSSLSNLCFISPGTMVIDILAPYHQDAYYWMITNIRESRYVGFFGDGMHPPDEYDLVRNKIDHDILIDIAKMKSLLDSEILYHENI
jgi:capsular polysaccharide biosynthesis protein